MATKKLSFNSIRESISSLFRKIPDTRQLSKVMVNIHDALMSGLACMYFQDSSLLQFQKQLQDAQHKNNLKTLFDVENIPKETQMRTIIDQVNSEHFTGIFDDIHAQLKENGHMAQYELLPGMFLFPFDGTTYFSSGKVHCDKCLIKKRHSLCYFDFLSELPENTKAFKPNTYLLIQENEEWRLLYINDAKDQIQIKVSTIVGLESILINKNIIKLSTADNKKRLKKIFKKHHDSHCEHSLTYSHQALQGGIMHPDQKVIIPFMPEEIRNTDGTDKQDCEMNAAKRLVDRISKNNSGIIFNGDSLFSKQPLIEHILLNKNHYLFSVKLTDHKYLKEWLSNSPPLKKRKHIDDRKQTHCYEWLNTVPLNSRADRITVNLIRYTITDSSSKIKYQNIWVTDIEIHKENVKTLVLGGRCRWKSENEGFNVLKNHGYELEHNYGHGDQNLCFNFYLLTLLAFFMHQLSELTCYLYKAARKKFSSKKHMWETLRSYIKIIVFASWEALLSFALNPPRYTITESQPP